MVQSRSRSQGITRREVQRLVDASVKPALARVRELDKRLKAVERRAGNSTTATARRPARRTKRKATEVQPSGAQ